VGSDYRAKPLSDFFSQGGSVTGSNHSDAFMVKGIMHMLRYGKGTLLTTVMAGLLALSLLTAGCGSTTPTKSAAVSVKAMKVLQQDTAVSHDYSGQIKSTNAVTIKPRVSGEIVEKYFTAGDPVEKGQPLYKIDDRQYESEVLSAKSNVDKARTTTAWS